ncbi:MAG: hypothetical protein U1A77_26450 [Pirellulales bacterium]
MTRPPMSSHHKLVSQVIAFSGTLQAVGVEATVVPGEEKNHGTINRDLGAKEDKPTKAVFEFLRGRVNKS